MEIINLDISYIELITSILYESFLGSDKNDVNCIFNLPFPSINFKKYYKLLIKYHFLRGNPIYGLMDNGNTVNAISVLRLPQNYGKRGITIKLYISIFFEFGLKTMIQMRKYAKALRSKYPTGSLIYINFLAVVPRLSRHGYGTRLLCHAFELSRKSNMSSGIAVETSSLELITFYQKNGFLLYDKVYFKDKYIYIMYKNS